MTMQPTNPLLFEKVVTPHTDAEFDHTYSLLHCTIDSVSRSFFVVDSITLYRLPLIIDGIKYCQAFGVATNYFIIHHGNVFQYFPKLDI